MSTNQYGRKLEDFTKSQFEQITTVSYGSKSGSSGNPASSDLFTPMLQIECKRRNQKNNKPTNTIIQETWWQKVRRRSQMNGKIAAIVTSEETLSDAKITMKLIDFITMISLGIN
ncbi:MAG: hypothetical protein DRN27_08360 [Thermoplasmata archaeon]|nr:MAG: hypothetical protein DRN27_08360 [Thermoplasmata archaeon]